MIKYLVGDATRPKERGNKVIVHICNDIGLWGAGFVLALSNRWDMPKEQYIEWYKRTSPRPLKLGLIQYVQVEPDVWVANLIGQRDIKRIDNIPPIRYQAVQTGLTDVAKFAVRYRATVHMPRIGCGLAGGSWDEIERIIQKTLVAEGIEVFVYDLPS